VFPLCLGGSVFGWTVDEPGSFEVLDAYMEAGGNFIDTADVYSAWAPGNSGGESEWIIGRWMAARRNREDVILATKVGALEGAQGLSAHAIRAGIDGSLRRLGTDYVDLYYAHFDDADADQLETMRTLDSLVREGKVRCLGVSNFAPVRVASALDISAREGLESYAVVQAHYNLVHRGEYEGPLAELCAQRGIACLPFRALGSGFLSGKYRRGDAVTGARAEQVSGYVNEAGFDVLDALDAIAERHRTSVSAVALAWLIAQPTVVAPVAGANTPAQLSDLLRSLEVELSAVELDSLRTASDRLHQDTER
jgi:aryl-alcohol dehydrogenase-like predicted oxidoreductase